MMLNLVAYAHHHRFQNSLHSISAPNISTRPISASLPGLNSLRALRVTGEPHLQRFKMSLIVLYSGEADESEVTTRKAQSSADSPPVSAESSQHMINSDSHLAYPYHTDQRDEEHPTTSGGDQDPRALAISGPGMLDHSQGDTSPVAGSSSQTNDGASETRPNGRGRRFDPYTANNTKRKVTKKQKSDPTPLRLPSAPASHPTHLLPQHAYSLPHASSSYSIPPNYSVGFVYPPHYPTTPIAENLTPSFPTFHPSQTYHSQPLVSSPSAASTNYMHYPAYNPQAIPLSPASPMPYSPQLQPPRRPYGQDRSTHNNRVASSVSASRGHDIYQGSMDTSYNSEWKASNEVPVNHHSNVPLEHEHPFYHPGTNYGHQTHPNDPDRAGVPVWSTVKGESGSSLLDV